MKNFIAKKIEEYFKQEKINFDISKLEVLKSNKKEFGDFNTNVSLKLAQQLKKSPMEIAEKMIEHLSKNKEFTKIELLKPGFINFYIDDSILIDAILSNLITLFKKDKLNLFNEKINYEYVSANPTGFLHMGHARNAIVGDVVCRLYEYMGADLVREYYINDAGNQIKGMALSIMYHYNTFANNKSVVVSKEEVIYNGKEIIELGKKIHEENKNLTFKNKEEAIKFFAETGKKYFLAEIKKTLTNINVLDFKYFTSEKSLFDSGSVDKFLTKLSKTNYYYEKDGAKWLKTSDFNDDKDRVIIKKDGGFTYMVADVANHVQKYERGFEKLLNLWGSDHHGYEERIKATCQMLGHDSSKIEVFYISMVKITKNKQELKMSKRSGTSLLINDVVELIKPDLLRYSIISKTKEQNLVIDIDEIEKKELSNPYYYIQYANARINNLLLKYESKHGKIKNISKYKLIGKEEKEKELLLNVNEFIDIIKQSAIKNEPNILWNYLFKLAINFHSYYNSCIIIGNNKELSLERINLIILLEKLFSKIFFLFGMTVIKKM